MDWASIDRLFKALLFAAKEQALISGDCSGFIATYKKVKQEIPHDLAIRLSGCNRVLLTSTLFKLALGDTCLSYSQLAALVASIDQAIKDNLGRETRPCTKERLGTASRRFKQYMCPHALTAIRVRHSRPIPQFTWQLTTPSPISLITYCSACSLTLITKEMPFAHADALKLLATPKTVAEFIDELVSHNFLKPIENPDARKQRSSEYMSTKNLIDAYAELGVVVFDHPDRTRNRIISLTELGRQIIGDRPCELAQPNL